VTSCSAGTILTTNPVSSVATSVKPTDTSTDTVRSIGMLTAVVPATHFFVIQNARPTPNTPPHDARMRLSVSS
jgi:hypothetical protein